MEGVANMCTRLVATVMVLENRWWCFLIDACIQQIKIHYNRAVNYSKEIFT